MGTALFPSCPGNATEKFISLLTFEAVACAGLSHSVSCVTAIKTVAACASSLLKSNDTRVRLQEGVMWFRWVMMHC